MGDYMYELYFDTSEKETDYRVKNGLIKDPEQQKQNKYKDFESTSSLTDEENIVTQDDYIMRDLFLWSVLMNYPDMAQVFLSHMKYRICPALIATKIFKQYHKQAVYGELKDSYKTSAEYFEQYAIDCLENCDDNDADKACQIVLQQNELYGYVTCLQV
jgi:hypothetical protein